MRPAAVLMLTLGCRPASVDTDPPNGVETDTDTATDTGGDTGAWAGPTRVGACDVYDVVGAQYRVADLVPLDPELDDLADAGITLARPHRFGGSVFAMNYVVGMDGSRDWSMPDHVVAESGRRGISLFVTLHPYSEPRDVTLDNTIHPVVPAHLRDIWRDFVRDVVERYDGDGIDDAPGLVHPVLAWEIGNEPHCPRDGERCLADYVELVALSAAAIREADPDATVLPGGAASHFSPKGTDNWASTSFFRYFFENGGADHVDAFGFHVNVGEPTPVIGEHVAAWREMTDLPLWLTETGARNVDRAIQVAETGAERAAWMRDHLDAAFAAGVERAFWCKAQGGFRDDPEVYEAVARWVADDVGPR